ncbi:hypothetical protein H257_14342 [Aphanomyces astaci]|uniref:Uncharacterized protein n=1 Tax=Aphanomyces astaci TaxID=112090 RepID=W4FSY4_APHAT|nr:hypothetical protein H257_14342 [Aphanomyces astaci]ETV69969.1 hypothetical protein H257_14342 [Aphanomyces astaci]|eukprot:XP_009840412.1 hypothetical protein H257_14342 [Aphanomyces astaci]
MPTPFEAKMARMLLALDAVDISKGEHDHDMGGATFMGGHRYFLQSQSPEDVTDEDIQDDEHLDDGLCPAGTPTVNANSVPEEEGEEGEVELYGDSMDDDDDAYVSKNLRGDIDPDANAALACPCCFMTVSYASQRHEKYDTQYRASKAVNCRINADRTFVYDSHKKLSDAPSSSHGGEVYVAVECSDCSTVVGVKLQASPSSQLSTIHFFHVIPSHI